MTRDDLRLKLQVLLGEFSNEHGLDSGEIHTIVTTMTTLIYSDKNTRLVWYKEMQKVANMIANNLNDQAKMILATLDLTEEEQEELKKKIEERIGKTKVEN